MTSPHGPHPGHYPGPAHQGVPYQGVPYQGVPYPAFSPPRRTNSMAVGSLICGVLGLVTGLAGIPAVVLGHIARRQIARSGEDGAGLALTGLILGYVSVAVTIAAVVFYAWVISVFVNA